MVGSFDIWSHGLATVLGGMYYGWNESLTVGFGSYFVVRFSWVWLISYSSVECAKSSLPLPFHVDHMIIWQGKSCIRLLSRFYEGYGCIVSILLSPLISLVYLSLTNCI